MNDADETATITTFQRPRIKQLERNPDAEKLEDLSYGSSVGATYRVHASQISIRKRTAKRTAEQRAAAAAQLAKARRVG